jgi:hypothetical protein
MTNTIPLQQENVLKLVSILTLNIEKVSFNQDLNIWQPSDAPLIRLSFDARDTYQASRHVKPMKIQGLRQALNVYLIRAGLRQAEHPTEHNKRVRKNITLANGFRKFVISTFIEADLNHEIRELLVDHATGLDASYFRPSEKQVLEEYLKAEPYLTIDPSVRLQQENQNLKVEVSRFDNVLEDLNNIKKTLGIS